MGVFVKWLAHASFQIKAEGKITSELMNQSLKILEVDEYGLDKIDRDFLTALCLDHHGGPVGLETLAAGISEDEGTIEDVIEPYLLKKGLIKRTSRGRTATPKAFKHLAIPIPKNSQASLF